VLLRHQGPVNAASFSPDGKRIVTASTDETARVWGARSGEPLSKPVQHQQPVAYAEFSPDGARIVTVSRDNTVRVWNARTGAPLSTPFQHESVLSAPFSLDDTRIVTTPSVAPVWNAQVGESLSNLPRRREDRAVSGPDGSRVVTASFFEDAARLWNGRTGDVLSKDLQHQGRIAAVSFSPDGARIVTASEDATARLWDARTGEPLARPFRHGSRVTAVVFSADGTRILTTCNDNTAWVWDTPVYSEEEVPQLVELAEAVGGETLSELGGAVPLSDQNGELVRLRTRYGSATEGPSSVASLARWLFADPWTRTISSLSALTVPEYICDAIRRGAVEEVRKAFPDHPLLRESEAAAIPADCLTARERAQ
jgi:WD40 repeat protein